MHTIYKKLLFWSPRILSIIFIAFLSLFALDVFGEDLGFWQKMIALIMHLIPAFLMILILVLAWKWEWIGAALYAAAGLSYAAWAMTVSRPISAAIRLSWVAAIAVPAFIISGLFLANWRKHDELRSFK